MQHFLDQIDQAPDKDSLEKLRLEVMGKKGWLTLEMKALGQLEGDARRAQGEKLNCFKEVFLDRLHKRRTILESQALEQQLASETLDVTLPPFLEPEGKIHPLSRVMQEIMDIFIHMGFEIEEGYDIEEDAYNFDKLNIPADHPARTLQDTFYLPSSQEGKTQVLRTHTSPVQIRTLEKRTPPLRVIAPGRVYRSDYDQTHTPMFHQVEGFVVEEGIHMGHLKGCLEDFFNLFFEKTVLIRFRPSFFPFTEPSAEVDICFSKGTGEEWLEVLGCGMIHPHVFKNCGLEGKGYQGFAFGMGVERLAMIKYGISDLRYFFDNDQRWLSSYGFSPYNR